jgi:hypothetical protein
MGLHTGNTPGSPAIRQRPTRVFGVGKDTRPQECRMPPGRVREQASKSKPKSASLFPRWFALAVVVVAFVLGARGLVKQVEDPSAIKLDFGDGVHRVCLV